MHRPEQALVLMVFGVTAVRTPGNPAMALSCAEHPEGSPTAIVQGRDDLASGNPFFEHYDFAITGTVGEITTNNDGESDNYGFTQLEVAVINGYGIDSVPDVVTVSEPDPGWLQGYEFTSGDTYFIPIFITDGPDGEQNNSNGCDPITQLTVADAEQLALQAAADVIVSTPEDEVVPEPGPSTTVGEGSTDSASAAPRIDVTTSSLRLRMTTSRRPGPSTRGLTMEAAPW